MLWVFIVTFPLVPVSRRVHKLPALLLREIGRLITIFSCIEHEMNFLTFSLLRLSPAEGRLALVRQNVRSRFHLISVLLGANDIKVTHNLKVLASEIEELEEVRDWIAHGVWSKEGKTFRLEISKGTWKPRGSHRKVERKIIPAAAPIDYQALHRISDVAVELLAVVGDTHKQVVAQLQPLPGKHRGSRRGRTTSLPRPENKEL